MQNKQHILIKAYSNLIDRANEYNPAQIGWEHNYTKILHTHYKIINQNLSIPADIKIKRYKLEIRSLEWDLQQYIGKLKRCRTDNSRQYWMGMITEREKQIDIHNYNIQNTK